MRTLPLRGAVALLTIPILVGAVGCSSSSDGGDDAASADLPTVTLDGVVPDPMSVPVMLIKEQGLDEKYGFHFEYTEGEAAGGTTPFLKGEVQLGPGDAISAAIANMEGHDTVAYYPFMSQTAGVVASAASGITTPEQLRGRRIGHFGNDSGTTQALTLTLQDCCDIDVQKDLTLVQSSPEALPALLEQGEVDAIFDFEPFGDQAIQMTDGVRVLQVAEYWKEKDGWVPPLAMLWSNRTWLDENPELARNVQAAFQEAMQIIIDANYETFKEEPYASYLDMEPDAMDRLITYCQELPCYTNTWTAEDATKMNDWIQTMADQGMLPGFPQNVPSQTLDEVLGDK